MLVFSVSCKGYIYLSFPIENLKRMIFHCKNYNAKLDISWTKRKRVFLETLKPCI